MSKQHTKPFYENTPESLAQYISVPQYYLHYHWIEEVLAMGGLTKFLKIMDQVYLRPQELPEGLIELIAFYIYSLDYPPIINGYQAVVIPSTAYTAIGYTNPLNDFEVSVAGYIPLEFIEH